MGIPKIRTSGFTIVELAVTIAVIGILAGVSIVGYGAWQQRAAETTVKSDLTNVVSAMESAKNFSSTGYPLSIPSTFKKSSGVSFNYTGNSTTFCIEGTIAGFPSVIFYVDSTQGAVPQSGTCAGGHTLAAPTPLISAITSSSFRVSWANVSGATSYTVKYGTSSPTITSACTSTPCDITGLSASTTYYVTVTATNSYGSTTSSVISATTAASGGMVVTAPSTPLLSSSGTTATVNMTASGGVCSVGTTQWKFLAYRTSTATQPTPDWNSASWTTSTSYSQTWPGKILGNVYIQSFAKPQCTNGTTSVEYGSYAYDVYCTSCGGGPQ